MLGSLIECLSQQFNFIFSVYFINVDKPFSTKKIIVQWKGNMDAKGSSCNHQCNCQSIIK